MWTIGPMRQCFLMMHYDQAEIINVGVGTDLSARSGGLVWRVVAPDREYSAV